jgi:hypothetical protein
MPNESPTPDIDAVLGDNSRQRSSEDDTGFSSLVGIMLQAKQITDAAKTAGFPEDLSYQFARDYLDKVYVVMIAQSLQG